MIVSLLYSPAVVMCIGGVAGLGIAVLLYRKARTTPRRARFLFLEVNLSLITWLIVRLTSHSNTPILIAVLIVSLVVYNTALIIGMRRGARTSFTGRDERT